MSPSDFPSGAEDFSGRAALFPLPNLTLFPNVVLPLHVFEPRYRCMVEDVLKTDKYVALALLKDGHEDRYHDKDCPIHSTVCLSRIIADEQLNDGRYYLLTQGLRRARITREVQTDLPYRIGQLELLPDVYPSMPVIDRERRQLELINGFRMMFPKLNIDETLLDSLGDGVPLGELCDVIAHAMRLNPGDAQRLLEQSDVDQRSDLVLELLKLQCRPAMAPRPFPPEFSIN